MHDTAIATFNLWNEAWIGAEARDGNIVRRSIRDILVQAGELRGFFDPSPLYVVGVHRLLVAILQSIYQPLKDADLRKIWQAGAFSEEMINTFGKQYANRFDLFSEKEPFLQSADIPLTPGKETKSIAYLAPDIPSGTEVTHFRHGGEDEQAFCPSCCALGLIAIPAFATSGGAGIRPSINGVPPLYIIPGGENLFYSLTASLVRPDYQPRVASLSPDKVWWVREPIVKRGEEVLEVGYLHSLTFPARRVRLYPEISNDNCTRCGTGCRWLVQRMVYEMGETRPKTAPFWFDPFVAYRISEDKPRPVRPEEGKAAWREFSALFLRENPSAPANSRTQRPSVLDQIAGLELDLDQVTYPFRAIGMRTDMKAKIFEWVEAGFEIPPSMLRDENAGLEVQMAVDFSSECAKVIAKTFREYFGGSSKKTERHKSLKNQMEAEYWSGLADEFRRFILTIAEPNMLMEGQHQWAESVVRIGGSAFQRAIERLDDDAEALSLRVRAEKWCRIRLIEKRKEFLHE